MEDAARVEKDRAWRHFGVRKLVRRGSFLPVPCVASGNTMRCAVLFCKFRERPYRIELWFDGFGKIATPCETVSMQGLFRAPRMNTYSLGQVQQDFLGKWSEELAGSTDHQRIED